MKLTSQIASVGFFLTSLAWLSVSVASTPLLQGVQSPTADQVAFFEAKIRPVLADNCFACHGPKVQMAGLRLDSDAGVQKGADSGKVIFAGDTEKSSLIRAVRHSGTIKMPPQGKKLKPEEIANLEAWVKMGAPWPKATSVKADTKPALWSLQPVRIPSIPKVQNKTWVRNPVDAFVLHKLERKKMKPSAEADRRTLLRRLNYDLTGLPPTAAEVDAFLADKAPNAYEKAVDRLLASPRYGERQARLWLDVARYADTKGYVFEEDRNYPHAYTYRDWVIRAFNQDLPYDQFILQQLAADRLPEVQSGDGKRPLAALGFLTVGRRFLNHPPDIIDDRIDVTMRGFQGFTVSCARCHDHKFDPIPTQDYYSLYAVFASSLETVSPISEKAIRDPWEEYSKRVAAAEMSLRDLVLAQVAFLREMVARPDSKVSAEAKQALQMLRENQVPAGDVFTKLEKAFEQPERDRLARLQANLAEIRKSAPTVPEFAMVMVDSPNPHDGVVFNRGNPGNRGEPAPRRFLKALSKPSGEREHWKTSSGRLDLAKAIASKDNPLTARVYVNRVWQQHFGAGIVRTPSDFGHQGDKPTHPELLDYLASTFMEGGWSIKKLHRLIVTSATYRQSSVVTESVYNADPDNRYVGRMNRRRLDLEQMRDALVVATGRLNPAVGGKSVDLWSAPFTTRRALYGFVERQNLPGIFKTFDFASPDITSARRFNTTVPQQALFFMNSPFAVEQARSIAARAEIRDGKDDSQRVRRLYQLLFARLPSADETAIAMTYLKVGSDKTVAAPEGEWRYGYGAFDASQGKVTSFTRFKHFGDGGYRGGPAFPDPTLGYLTLRAEGGHPGRDITLSVIRRWIAPAALTVDIQGSLVHPNAQGDGVRARVVSNRAGVLGHWLAKNGNAKTEVASISVQQGETLDFVVDCVGNESFDAFAWAPIVRTADQKQAWNAVANFGPPPPPPLSRLDLYVQALLMSNEFLFVD